MDKYFNFPIHLIKDLSNSFNYDFEDSYYQRKQFLQNILDYTIYANSKQYKGNPYEKRDSAYIELNLPFDMNSDERFKSFGNGKRLFYKITEAQAMTGISKDMWYDFYSNESKEEKDWIYLLAFLGFKSIVGKKKYCKSNFKLLFSRMNGETKTMQDLEDLPRNILKYNTRKLKQKISKELQDNWNLQYYGYHVKGFYFSFKFPREEIRSIVEKNRPSNKELYRKNSDKAYREQLKKQLTGQKQDYNPLKKVV